MLCPLPRVSKIVQYVQCVQCVQLLKAVHFTIILVLFWVNLARAHYLALQLVESYSMWQLRLVRYY